MIEVRPWEDQAGYAVLSRLDQFDLAEAELTRGAPATGLQLFVEWRNMQPHRVFSLVVLSRQVPFAVLALANTGQSGVAAAAMLARDHRAFRGPIRRMMAIARRQMADEARRSGIHRIEARAWADHPTASRMLAQLGFAHECDMGGFGRDGRTTFRQFAWTDPALSNPPAQPRANPNPAPKPRS